MPDRLLVVEEGREIAAMLKMVLEDAGYEVLLAGSLDEGVRCLEQQTVSLVLTDSFSRSPAGALDEAQVLCERAGSAPVALMTGHHVELHEALARGYCDVIPKPFDIDDLVQRVKACLSQAASPMR
jgi:two-component system, OmpR family, response regulator AdeR